jgi:hypothetical protein
MKKLAVVIVGALALSGCGLRGDLQRAPPLFGPERQRYEAEKARQEAEAQAAKEAEEAKRRAAEAAKDAPAPAPQ